MEQDNNKVINPDSMSNDDENNLQRPESDIDTFENMNPLYEDEEFGNPEFHEFERTPVPTENPKPVPEEASDNTLWYVLGGLIIAAVVIVIGLFIYCYCCRSSLPASVEKHLSPIAEGLKPIFRKKLPKAMKDLIKTETLSKDMADIIEHHNLEFVKELIAKNMPPGGEIDMKNWFNEMIQQPSVRFVLGKYPWANRFFRNSDCSMLAAYLHKAKAQSLSDIADPILEKEIQMFQKHLAYSSLLYVIENFLRTSDQNIKIDKDGQKKLQDERQEMEDAIVVLEEMFTNYNVDTSKIIPAPGN